MSAWIVSKDHIDLVLTAAITWCITTTEQADETGRMLWKENLASVAYRYPHDRNGRRPGPDDFRDQHTTTYRFQTYPGRVDPEVVDSAARSLEHQSCEHPQWATSKAREWVHRLHLEAITRTGAYLAEHGPIDVKRQPAGETGWYIYTTEAGPQIGCSDGWLVPDRDVFIRAASLRTTPATALDMTAICTRRDIGGHR